VHNKTLQDIFFPVVLMFNAVPLVAKAPVLVLIMGNGVEPKITIAALVCFFPTLVNMVRGLESVNPQAMELMRVLSASKTEIFFRLRLLNALPYLFSALRIAASMCVIGAVVGEWVGATVGVGAMIIQATFNFDSALLYSAIVMSATGPIHVGHSGRSPDGAAPPGTTSARAADAAGRRGGAALERGPVMGTCSLFCRTTCSGLRRAGARRHTGAGLRYRCRLSQGPHAANARRRQPRCVRRSRQPQGSRRGSRL